jgi:hypothetical protein
MFSIQYDHFRDIDRRCVAEGLDPACCAAAVEHKRRVIDSTLNRSNPLVADVLEGRTTFVQSYDGFSRAFRGLRRFVPKSHDAGWNERLEQLALIVPNVRHFRRRSILACDNPTSMTAYGVALGAGLAVLLTGANDPGEPPVLPWPGAATALLSGCTALGFVLGTAAMLKYRIRDYNQIHAREAAGYMDFNYKFFRSGDLAGWADYLRREGGGPQPGLARPD